MYIINSIIEYLQFQVFKKITTNLLIL